MYILQVIDGNHCRGIYSSKEELIKGVDFWMSEFPKQSLAWTEWTVNYIYEGNSWDYAYISKSELRKIKSWGIKGGCSPEYFPSKSEVGLNLVRIRE